MTRRPVGPVLFALILLGAASARVQAETSVEPGPWKFGTTAGFTLSQSSFSGNWAGGDKGSIVWVLNGDMRAERQFSTRYTISNVL